ncbi:MerR family transcriptional regulator [Streptomyces diacarni]|uniref:MerR family transcriptional regulator n=1 Tax=Streptomyces diacarni TaxID=2800381 RepID=UPI00340AE450
MSTHATPCRTSATPEAEVSLFSVGVAAQRLQTKAATLRAWGTRYGLEPSGRTPGGHRRYSLEDLQRLDRMLHLVREGVAAAEAARAVSAGPPPDSTGSVPVSAQDLRAAMDAFDPEAVTRLAAAALARQGAALAWTTVFAPALVAIGEHWDKTGCGVETEHMTSGLLEAALRQHAQAHAPNPSAQAPLVLLAATSDEQHTLPLTALAAALADRSYTSVLLGSLPSRYLIEAISRTQPHATVLWARDPATADTGMLQDAASSASAPVYPAGPGWPCSPCTGHAASVLQTLPQSLDVLTGI